MAEVVDLVSDLRLWMIAAKSEDLNYSGLSSVHGDFSNEDVDANIVLGADDSPDGHEKRNLVMSAAVYKHMQYTRRAALLGMTALCACAAPTGTPTQSPEI